MIAPYCRRTLSRAIELSGVGLFTGAPATVRIVPMDHELLERTLGQSSERVLSHPGYRFVFRRSDIAGSPCCLATAAAISTTPVHPAFATLPPRCTSLDLVSALTKDNTEPIATIATVEHTLSALVGSGITDAIIEIDAPEMPIFDGSALPFVQAIQSAGVRTIAGQVQPIIVRESIMIEVGDAGVQALPISSNAHHDRDTLYTYALDYGDSSPIRAGMCTWRSGYERYIEHELAGDGAAVATGTRGYASLVAPARTFGLESEVGAMQRAGLFSHLSTRDLLVIGEHGPIDNQLRSPMECALHKLLDLVGDLALAGAPIVGHIVAEKSGHTMNHALARALRSI